MSLSTPPFHDLEFTHDSPLWPPEDTPGRRVFLMPAADASLFVAFGVHATPAEVDFVARGSLGTHLGPFIEQRVREECPVELYIQPPVPKNLLEQYGAPPPFEGHEFENPPKPPVAGVASDQVQPYPAEVGGPPWTPSNAVPRRTFLVPLSEPSTFLALGLAESSEEVLFALKGGVTTDLPRLLGHLRQAACRVELFAKPPLSERVLSAYLTVPLTP